MITSFTLALSPEHVKVVIQAKDFNFATATCFIMSAKTKPELLAKLTASPKVLIDVSLTNARSLDAVKLGRWLRDRKTPTIEIEYRARRMGEVREVLAAMTQLETVLVDASEEVLLITAAVGKFAKEFEEATRTQAVLGAGGLAGIVMADENEDLHEAGDVQDDTGGEGGADEARIGDVENWEAGGGR